MRYVKRVLRLLLVVSLVVLAFAAGALAVFTLTERGRENLAGLISDFASSPGQTVRISGLDGIWSGKLTLDNVVVEDAGGPWLVARGIQVDWSPLSLFSATFKADRIFADRLEMARLPEGESAPTSERGATLPVSLQLSDIDLPDIALGPELAGGLAAISAKGSVVAEASPVRINTKLKLARTDGPAGSVVASIHFEPEQKILDIELSASEPAGGIIANLLQVPGEPAVDIRIAGSGPAADWAATGEFALDGVVVTQFVGRHRLTGQGNAVEANGQGDFARFVPEALRPLLSGKTVFDVAGTATAAGGVVVERAMIESETVRGTASGIIDPQGASDFALEFAAKDAAGVPLSFGTDESPIDMVVQSGSVRAIGAGSEPNLDVTAALARVETRSARIANLAIALHSDAFSIRTRSGPVTGNAAATAIAIDNPTLQPLAAGKVSVDLAGMLAKDTLTVTSGSLSGDALSGTFAGNVSLADGSIALDLNADVASAALPAAIRGPLGERTAIAASLVRDTQGKVSADPFSISSGGFTAGGSIATGDAGLDAAVKGALADIGTVAKGATGPLQFSVTASGSLATPDVSLTAESEGIRFMGRDISALKLEATSKVDPANPAADISLTGSLGGETISAKGAVALADGRLGISGLTFALGANRVSGDLVLGADMLPTGTLALELPDIAPLAALAGEAVTGNLTGTARLETVDAKPRIVVEADVKSLSRNDLAAADATVSATITDYLTLPAVSGRIRAGSVTSGTTVIRDIDIALDRDGEWTRFDGGASVAGIPAKAQGRLRVAGGETMIELAAGEATVSGVRTAVAKPATIRIAGGNVVFDAVTLDVNGATAVISGSAGAAYDLNATVTAPNEGMALAFGTPESPIDIVLRSASLHALGHGKSPSLDVAASLSSIATNEARLESLDLSLHSDAFDISGRTGPVVGNAVAAALSLNNSTLQPLITGTLKTSLTGTLGTDTLEVANGSLSSDALNGAFSGSVSLASGAITLKLDADVASSALPPAARKVLAERTALSGTVIRDADGKISADGLSVQSGALTATATGTLESEVLAASLSGKLGDIGLLAPGTSGAVDFALDAKGPLAAPDLSATLTSESIQAAGREITGLKLTATGKAGAANPAADISMTGNLGGETVTAKGAVALADGRPAISGLALALGANHVSGDLVLGADFLPTGTLAVQLPELAPLAALAGQTISGDLAGTVRLETVEGKPRAVVEAQAKSLVRDGVTAADAAVSATISDYLTLPAVSGRIRAGSVTSGTTVIRDVDVMLDRDGDWTRFDGGASISGIPARATGRVHVGDGETTVELSGGEATVAGIRAAVAQPSTVRVAGGNVNFDAVTLDVNGATAVISGSAGAAYDLNAMVTAPDEGMALSFGSPESPIDIVLRSASLHALGDGKSPNLDVEASLSSVATNSARLESLDVALHSDGFDIAARAGPVSGTATAAALSLNNATLQPLITGTIKASLNGTLGTDTLEVANGSLSSDAMTGGFSGSVSLATGAITLKLDADVASSALPAPLRGVLAERTALAGSINRDPDGKISAEGLSVQSGSLAATGTAVVDKEALEASVSGKLADVGLLAPGASGAIDFALDAKGPLTAPDLSATISSERIQTAGREITGLKLTATGKADAANPAAQIALTGTVGGEALAANASVASADGRREIKGLSLALGPNSVSGDLMLGDDFLPTGTLALQLPDIAPLAALAGQTVSGDLAGTVRLETVEGKPRAVIEAQSKSLVRDVITAADATVSATVSDYLTLPAVSGRIRAATVTSGTTVIRDIDLMLDRDGDWTRFDGGASISGIPARATGRVRVGVGETTVELSGGEATVAGIRAAVAQPSTVRIAGGDVVFDSVTLDVNGATAVISGSAGAAYDLNTTVTAPNEGMALSFGSPESPIDIVLRSASLHAQGDRNSPNLDVAVSLSSVATNSARLESLDVALHSDAFDIATRTGPVSGNATAAALSLNNATLQPLITGTIKTSFAGTLGTDTLDVANGTLSSDAMTGGFSGRVSLATGAITLKLDADVASEALPAPLRGVLAERTALAGSINRDAQGKISAEGLSVQSGSLAATGTAVVDKEALEASVSGKLADVGLLSESATGSIDFALSAKGPTAAPDLSLTVSSDGIEVAGRQISGLKLVATGKADPANPAADVALSGTVAGEALQGQASLATTGGRREIKGLSLSLGQNRISGDLLLDEKFLPLGSVSFVLPDLGPLAALALETAEGDLSGTVTFAQPGGRPELTVDARTAALSRGDIAAKDVSISALVADYVAAPTISGKVSAASVTSGTTVANDIDVTLTRDGDWTGFDGGATVAGIPARAAGRVRIGEGRTVVELASGEATIRGIRTALARATTIEIAGGVTTLDKLALDLGGGSAVVSGTAGSTLNLTATLATVPASLANTFAPALAAAGSISGTAKVTGPASSPTVAYSIDWANAETAQTRSAGFGAMRVTSSGDFAGGKLTFKANAGDGSGLGMQGGGTVDTRTSALALDFTGNVPFSFLTRRLAAQGLSLSGGANVALQVRGPMSSPAVGGSVRASGARLVDARSGLAVNDISADISLGNGVATIRSMRGTLSTRGSLSASGTVGIDPARGFPADLSIRIADGRYTDGRVVTATLSGDLTIKGALATAPTLSGTINLARTVITVPERLPTSLSTLGVRHKNAPAAVRRQQAALQPAGEAGGSTGGLTLDVTVNAANQIFVQGRGLDAELGGSLRLTGPVGSPQASGQFTLNRGRLAILGKRLTFTRGTITFSGSLVPFIDLSADSSTGDATVTVTVSGPADSPRFSFTSVPALPEDEVLAQLIFGRSMSNLSPLQIAQLAEAAAQFAGVGGSTSLLENLRSKIGVDDLDIRTDEKGGTSIAVGKYLNDRTYFSIEKGDRAGSGKARIDLNVGRGVKLRGEATDEGDTKGGIFFEREY